MFETILIIVGILWVIGMVSSWFDSSHGAGSAGGDVTTASVGAFRARLVDSRLDDDDPDSPRIKEVHVRGMFPVSYTTEATLIVSLLDITDKSEPRPIICHIDQLQEDSSTAFQSKAEFGSIGPDQGIIDWVKASTIIPETLQSDYQGQKDIAVVLRLVKDSDPPLIMLGYSDGSSKELWSWEGKFAYNFTEPGYQEASENEEEARALAIQFAVAVGWADGEFDDSEGEVIKDWIKRTLHIYSDEKQTELKERYNNALREAYSCAENGTLSLSDIAERLNEIGAMPIKYDALELALSVMSADGEVDIEEMRTIKNVAEKIGVDYDKLQELIDTAIVDIQTSDTGSSLENVLGIEADWGSDEIKSHLRREFQKWNNRLNTLSEGQERDNAQRMLDLIAEARKKYI